MELTQEEQELLQEDINRDKLKKIDKFMWRVETMNEDLTIPPVIKFEWEDFKKLISYFEARWNDLLEKLKKEIKTRKKTELKYSETDYDYLFIKILQEFIKWLWESEWEKVIKEYWEEQIENIESNIYNKVSELYDAPVYSNFDMLKREKNDYMLFWKRIEMIRESFNRQKQKISNPNPYEDE